MKIALATCLELPEPDHDQDLMLEALRQAGHEAEMLAWDDPISSNRVFDSVVIRSTWNYPFHKDKFEQWIRETSEKTCLLNPAAICLANIDKRYLREIAQRGVRIVPTHWLQASETDWLRRMVRFKFVLKPTVGAGSLDTRVFEADEKERAIEWIQTMDPDRVLMAQPYLESVETVGEQSIIVIGKTLTHMITKKPRLHDDDESVSDPVPIPDDLVQFTAKVLEPFEDNLLYARVDVMKSDDGEWLLSELEVLEPSLFFKQFPDALQHFVCRIEELVHRSQSQSSLNRQVPTT